LTSIDHVFDNPMNSPITFDYNLMLSITIIIVIIIIIIRIYIKLRNMINGGAQV
jgi:hypothetical protein